MYGISRGDWRRLLYFWGFLERDSVSYCSLGGLINFLVALQLYETAIR
jgi:hypothetical protein